MQKFILISKLSDITAIYFQNNLNKLIENKYKSYIYEERKKWRILANVAKRVCFKIRFIGTCCLACVAKWIYYVYIHLARFYIYNFFLFGWFH